MRVGSWLPALLAVGTVAAWAQTPPQAAGSGWGVSAGVQQRRLVERADDGRRLVEESGFMLRLAFDAGLPLAGGGALQATVGAATGTLDYDGQTQGGAPLRTDTGHRDLDVTLAWRPLTPAAWGEAWLVLRTQQQRRQIASTPAARGLRETSLLVLPGLRWTHAFEAASWRWQPSLELRASVRHDLQVDFGGLFDQADLDGGSRREAVLGVDVGSPASPWSFGLAWTRARQSASPTQTLLRGGVPVGTVRQPRIEIDDVLLRVRRAF
jgi:hypothetical protein